MNISELLNLTYEVEGLLLLLQDRGITAPSSIKALIAKKSAQLAAETATAVGEVTSIASVADVSPAVSEVKVAQVDSATEVLPVAEVAKVAMAESSVSVDSAIVDSAVSISEETLVTPVDVVAPVAVVGEAEKAPEVDIEAPEESNIEIETPEQVAEVAELPAVAEMAPKAMIAEKESEDEGMAEEDAVAVESIRLDEKLAREGSRDLRKAFSLNDRFRFRRELFGNSDIEMTDTLNLVEAMTNYAEAVDYFMSDLQWDEENPDVADFLAIIQKHFATR